MKIKSTNYIKSPFYNLTLVDQIHFFLNSVFFWSPPDYKTYKHKIIKTFSYCSLMLLEMLWKSSHGFGLLRQRLTMEVWQAWDYVDHAGL